MWIVRLALGNPYVVIVLALAILFLGAWVLVGPVPIATDLLPQFKTPAVQVLTFYPGMPAEVVEQDMSTRLQRWTGQSVGIEHQEAKSMLGVSIVRDYFHEYIDPDAAMAQVTSYAMSDLYYLPPGTIPPMVMPFDPTASIPLCLLSVASKVDAQGNPKWGMTQLYDVTYTEGRNKLQSIQGVVAPAVYGGKLRRIFAYLDRDKLEARDLSPMDVVNAIHRNNVFIPTGSARFGDIEYQLVSNAMVPTVGEINDFPVKLDGNAPVLIGDVANAEDAEQLQTNIVRNGLTNTEMLYIPIYRQPGANTLAVVKGVKDQLESTYARLDPGKENLDMDVIFDQSVFVEEAIVALAAEGAIGAGLAMIMILIFLGSFQSMFFIFLSLPLSILVALIGLYFTGNTINSITLGGLAISVGLLIDQSIVVLENVERHLEMGKTPAQAALDGALEVARPVLVIVVSICVVFFPIVFFTGIGKFLFTPLALTVTLAMAGSYIMALTVVPACGAKFLKARAAKHGGGWFDGIRKTYERMVEAALRAKWGLLFIIAAAGAATAVVIYPRIGQELFPQVDAGQFTVRVRATSGLKVATMEEEIIKDVEKVIRDVIPYKGQDHPENELERLVSNIGVLFDWPAAYTPNSGPMDAFILVQTKRLKPDHVYIEALRDRLPGEFPGIEFAFEPNSMLRAALNFGLPAPINVQVLGKDLHECLRIAERVKREIRDVPGTVDVRIQQRLDYPQYKLEIDRRKCAELGLAQGDVVKNVVTAFNSSVTFAKSFWVDERNGNHYWIGAQYPEKDMKDLNTLLNVPITSADQDEPVLLRNVAHFERSTAPSEVTHYNITRLIDVYAEVERDSDLGSVATAVEKKLAPISADERVGGRSLAEAGYKIVMRGEKENMDKSFFTMASGLLLSAVLVYLVMVIQFRSLLQPFIIMIAVVLGMMGVAWMLFLTDTYISIQSIMGVIMVVGISVSFGIILIDFANRRRAEGASPLDAIREAASIRLRPILMVSLAAMLGLIPMAIAGGANIPLARAVIGGVLASTVLTLFVVPVLYVVFGRDARKGAAA